VVGSTGRSKLAAIFLTELNFPMHSTMAATFLTAGLRSLGGAKFVRQASGLAAKGLPGGAGRAPRVSPSSATQSSPTGASAATGAAPSPTGAAGLLAKE